MHPPHGPAEVTGLILAGGRGQRMDGVDKGWVGLAGRPLVEIAYERFAPQVAEVLISANRTVERYARLARVVTDWREPGDESFAGPLAGVLSALRATDRPWLAVVPCDAPRLPLDLVARLAQAIEPDGVACAQTGERLQPLFALVARSALGSLERYLASGQRSAIGWMQACGARRVAFDDDTPFVNINTPDDAVRAAGA